MAKEIIFKTIDNKEYSCGDIGISPSEWYNMLLEDDAQQYIDALLFFLRKPKHSSSYESTAKSFDASQHFSRKITAFGQWVQKKSKRFDNISGRFGKDRFWCIVMRKRLSACGFYWGLHLELIEALRYYLMKKLIHEYQTKAPFNGYDEEYKWALLDDVEGKDAEGIIKCLSGKIVVCNKQVDGILKELWRTKPNELTTCINNLLNETMNLTARIEGFRDEMRSISPSDWESCADIESTASAILTCRNPNNYTFYENEEFQIICKFFGFHYFSDDLKYAYFITNIKWFVNNFGEEIQKIMMPQIAKYKNKPLNLAVQTLLWCMKKEMKAAMQTESIKNVNTNFQETMQMNKYQEYIDLLKETKNLVLTGAPGTGKTYMAQAIAEEMGAETKFVQFHPSYDYTDFVEGLRPKTDKNGTVGFELRDGVFKDFCSRAVQIVNNKSIEISDKDVLKAIDKYIEENNRNKNNVPDVEKVNLFRSKDVLYHHSFYSGEAVHLKYLIPIIKSEKKFSSVEEIASFLKLPPENDFYIILMHYLPIRQIIEFQRTNKSFVFIIDEINRGEISKIFGELFFSIDPGYRGEKGRICTQYQNMIEEGDVFKEGFYVPENVYIIGTMNDIDRSVESMDFAMRRRFTWKEVTPADTAYMLDDLDCGTEAKATMNRLNKVIEETEGLGAAYMIGPAYFLKLGENGGDFNKLWRMNIEPLLKEYLRGFRKAKEILDKFSKAYFNKIDED